MQKKFLNTDSNLPSHVKKLFSLFDEEMKDCGGVLRRRVPDSIITVKESDEDGDDKPMLITGIANLAKLDRWDETIAPDAWKKYLDRYMQNPIILRQHMQMLAVGLATKVEIREDGLYYEAIVGDPRLSKLTEMQKETRSLLAQKILRTNSVGFIPHIIEWNEDDESILHKECELLEISLVSIPMQPDSHITSVKSLWRKAMAVKEVEPDEMKGMLKECLDNTKSIATGVQTLVEAYTSDKTKAAAEIAQLKADNESIKKELDEMTKQSNALLEELQKQGITAED